jgi:hypothetical protein
VVVVVGVSGATTWCHCGWSQNDQSKVGIGHGTAVAGYGVAMG